jgi:DHA1 family multidrug resistance protein-like MFS transporter
MSQQTPSSLRTSSSFESQATTKNEPEVRNDASSQMHIAQITSRGEEYFERYGGDDIHEPPPEGFLVGGPKLVQSETTIDANMVTWDGPNDPSNPQNWSMKYKLFVTVVCTLITINVYVWLLTSLL